MEDDDAPSIIPIEEGKKYLSYHYTEGKSPGVLFCNGFQSSMEGNKAIVLEGYCRQRGVAYCRFDYCGHGSSSGKFVECTLSDWIQDALTILRTVMEKHEHIVVVGSSMGGWIACHLALQHPTVVVGLIGIAAAPDFLEDIFETSSDLQREEWKRNGFITLPTDYDNEPYCITWSLIEDARRHWNILTERVNENKMIPIKCRVRLLHGKLDEDVSWEKSMILMELLETNDVTLTVVKDGDHRLSRSQDLNLICLTLGEILQRIKT